MPKSDAPGTKSPAPGSSAVNPEHLALARVMAIPPYPPGRPISAVARELGLDPQQIIKLASNENPLGCSPAARKAIVAGAASAALYPDFDTFALREVLSRQLNVAQDRILPGSGSSEHIVLAARAFLEPGKAAVLSQYSFAAYHGAIASVGARAIIVPARNFALDVERMLAAIDASVNIVYVATPNNPTGTTLDSAALDALLEGIPQRVVVVLDEAYREFLEPADRPETDHLPERRPNVVVLRTFSKIHGLAGLRVGYALGDPRMIAILKRLQLPFSVSAIAEAAAVAALGDADFSNEARSLNTVERTRVEAALAAAGIVYVPSHGNFILLRVGSGRAVFQELLRRGVIVRPVDNYQLPEWIRVSIGLPRENDAFLGYLLEIVRR
ncbi:MAG TPA: histidinol-phosphate transaminase [Steroidobacteraceae bacterium]|nr:histidinol-phosphate transaminase [Steroidobacteraceae bacterium]